MTTWDYEPLMKGYADWRNQGKKSCSGPSMVSCLDELNNNSMFYKKLAVGSHYENGWVKKTQASNNVIPISRAKTLRNSKI
jgi:hypothetical protein